MKHSFWKENGARVKTGVLIALGAILIFYFVGNLGLLGKYLGQLASILAPIVAGTVIAYLLAPVCNGIENFLLLYLNRFRFPRKEQRRKKTAKYGAVTLSILFLVAVVAGFLWLVLSQVIPSVVQMVNSLPGYVDVVVNFTNQTLDSNPELSANLVKVWQNVESYVTDFFNNTILPNIQNYFNTFTSSMMQLFTAFYNIFIGIIVAIYLLSSRKTLAAQGVKMLYASLPVKNASSILRRLRYADRVFGKFLSGKILDSLITGVLCFIGVSILKIPYAMLISVIIGITNIIPFFGPIIGAVPSVFIILLIDPLKALYLGIFLVVLQQIDGNIIGPRILGGSTGLSGFWIMFAILFFGGWLGLPGMIIGVPLFAVLYSMIKDKMSTLLEEKKLPQQTDFYQGIREIDPRDYSEQDGLLTDEYGNAHADSYWEDTAYVGDESDTEPEKTPGRASRVKGFARRQKGKKK